MGIIDSISAGYRFLGRRVDLILIPVLLDLLLWLAPRLSVAPLFARLADAYDALYALSAADMPADLAAMTQGSTEMLRAIGETSNLWTGLVSGAVLHVPSLLATASLPPARGGVIEIGSVAGAAAIWLLLALLGLFLGVLYLELLARVLPLGATPKPAGAVDLLRATVRHWGRVLGFVLLVGALLVALFVPISLFVGLAALLVPALATFFVALLGGMILMIFVYLYFVTAAIVLDDQGVLQAIRTSMSLVRAHFLQVVGFAVLVTLIGAGIALLLDRLAAFEPVGTVAAILVNAYIGTGLSLALLVFYRSRLLLSAQVAEQSVQGGKP